MHIFWTTSRKLAHSWLEHPPEFWRLFTGENGDFTMSYVCSVFQEGFPVVGNPDSPTSWVKFVLSMYPGSFREPSCIQTTHGFHSGKLREEQEAQDTAKGWVALGSGLARGLWLMQNNTWYVEFVPSTSDLPKILPVPTSNNKLDPWWVVALQEVNVSFCAMKNALFYSGCWWTHTDLLGKVMMAHDRTPASDEILRFSVAPQTKNLAFRICCKHEKKVDGFRWLKYLWLSMKWPAISRHIHETWFLSGDLKYFSFFTPIWGRFPFWRIFFGWVETTNQDLLFKQVPRNGIV